MNMTNEKAAARPPIDMIDTEAEVLSNLALSVEDRLPQVGGMLLEEITRATLRPRGEIGPDVITMGAVVDFVDETTGAERTVQLVFPKKADIAAGRISILTPVGAGLIGLRPGQSIVWPDREGNAHSLKIVGVRRQG